MKRYLWLLLFFILAAGSVPAPAHSADSTPAADEDEKRLWSMADKEEKSLESTGLLYRDNELETYFDSVLKGLVPPETLAHLPVRIRVIRNPYLNAFALPNGHLYLNEGMLVRMENEAQLATLIGHELTHATHRHMLAELRNAKSKTAWFAALNSLTANLLAPISGISAMAMIQGYSRDMEREADTEGLRLLVAAGYDPAEAPKIFLLMQQEVREDKTPEPFFFASHPRLQERVDNFQALLKSSYAAKTGGKTNNEAYRRMITPLYLDNAVLDLKRGRFQAARRAIDKFLAVKGDDPKAFFLLGESWRQGRETDGNRRASEYYLKAAALDPSYPEPQRAMGMVAYKAKDWELARKSLERYLALVPLAADKAYIEQVLKKLKEVAAATP